MTGITEGITVFESGMNEQKNADGIKSYRIPALLYTDKGTLIAGADQRHDHHFDWGNIDMVVRRSADRGRTWGPIIKVVDLKENPDTENEDFGAAYNIDMALVQDPETKRIFALYDMYAEERGLFGMLEHPQNAKQHTVIEGKNYLNLYKSGEAKPYTVRDGGTVYTPEGSATRFRVITESENPPYRDLGDIYEGDERIGNVYFTTNSSSPFRITNKVYLWVSYSDDDGQTWSSPRDITPQVKADWMNFYGIGPGTGIVLHTGPRKGRIVVPTYSTNHDTELDGSQSARVIYSDDHGETWQSGEAVNDDRILDDGTVIHSSTMADRLAQNTEATVVQLNSGVLKMFIRNLTERLQVATSHDAGQTWENVVESYDDVNDVYCQLSSVQTVQDGVEYIVLTNANGPKRTNGYARVARVEADNTLSWINHKRIQEGKFAYNALQQIGDDCFGVLYEHAADPYNEYCLVFKAFDWEFLTTEA